MTAADRWHGLADAIRDTNLPASDRAVYRALLDKADWRTADLPARFVPRQREIARTTGVSLRQVKYSIAHLAWHGWLTAKGVTGPGRTLEYVLESGFPCTCVGRRHQTPKRVQPVRSTGATSAPERVQPTGATSQVRPKIALRGRDEEGEEEVSSLNPPARRGWPSGTIGAEVNGQEW